MFAAPLSVPHLIRTFFFSLAVLALTACGSADTPEAVVQTWYKAAAAGEAETATKHIYLDEVPAEQMTMAKGKVQMIVGEVANRAKANDGLKKIEVLETSMGESKDRATVKVRLIFGNGKGQTESVRLRRSSDKWKVIIG